MTISSRIRHRAGVAAIATAALAGALAGPLATGAHADNFVGTHSFQPRGQIGSLATAAVFPNPGPASVSVKAGSGFGGQWNTFNQTANGLSGIILKNRQAGLCLDTGNGGTSTSVSVRECDGTPSQNWNKATVPGTNFKTFQNVFTKTYLTTVLGSSTPTLQAFSSGNTKQHWTDTTLVPGN
ncbi:hypothetical protein [Streptomyces sp. NPDC056661]|uniref:hypothetical protein n=1 Tax=Streptomyces sp. NPDC056661 TaxID=3345898 RepID=UPI0036C6E9D6